MYYRSCQLLARFRVKSLVNCTVFPLSSALHAVVCVQCNATGITNIVLFVRMLCTLVLFRILACCQAAERFGPLLEEVSYWSGPDQGRLTKPI